MKVASGNESTIRRGLELTNAVPAQDEASGRMTQKREPWPDTLSTVI